MKIKYCFLLFAGVAGLLFTACSEDDSKQKYTPHYYYSYETGSIISASDLGLNDGEFTPGAVYAKGDTLFIANIKEGYYSLGVYSQKQKKLLSTLKSWNYQGGEQAFEGRIEAIAVSGDRVYLANMQSCIDVFDVNTLQFITRIGTRQWGEGANQMLHSHAMVVNKGYIIIRMKGRLQVYRESDVTAENYQRVQYYARGSKEGFDVNNGFYSHQMVLDSTGSVLLADYGQGGNKKIQVIDPSLIELGDDKDMVDDDRTLALEFNPCGIALHVDRMVVSAGDGNIYIYDRTKEEFIQKFKSVSGYQFSKPEKLLVNGDRLWVSDVKKGQLVGVDIFRNEIREY